MNRYTLNGQALFHYSIEQIIEIASAPAHHRHLGDHRDDYWRNRDLLAAFRGGTIATSQDIAAAFHAQAPRAEWSEHFNALRAGECLQWAIEHGIVERTGARPTPRWRLVHAEMQFELVGAAKKQLALRVRNVHPDVLRETHKLWTRELKRRERATAKAVEAYGPRIARFLDILVRRAPELPLVGTWLERYAVGQFNTIVACRHLIEDIGDLDAAGVYRLFKNLDDLVSTLPRETAAPPPPPAADLEILGDLQL